MVDVVAEVLHPAADREDGGRLPAVLLVEAGYKASVVLVVIRARVPRGDGGVGRVEDEAAQLLLVGLVALVERKLVRPPR